MNAFFDFGPVAIVYDDHQVFAEMFSSWLLKSGMFRHVYGFSKHDDLLHFFFEHDHKQVLFFCDYYIGDSNSMSTANDVKRLCPTAKIIFITSCINPILLQRLLDVRPDGILSKTPGLEEVAACIRQIEKHHSYVSPYLLSILDAQSPQIPSLPFTIREMELLSFFAKGYSVIKTAELLHLSQHTVVAHRRNMMRKARCKTITELLGLVRSLNIID